MSGTTLTLDRFFVGFATINFIRTVTEKKHEERMHKRSDETTSSPASIAKGRGSSKKLLDVNDQLGSNTNMKAVFSSHSSPKLENV